MKLLSISGLRRYMVKGLIGENAKIKESGRVHGRAGGGQILRADTESTGRM